MTPFFPKRELPVFALLFLLSVVFMLFISCWTSLLNPYFIYDSSMFCVIGKGWQEGLLPYRDIFDHKGCYLFAFYAIAAWFSNIKVGLTILLTILLTVDSVFVYKISRLFLSGKAVWGVVLLFYVLLAGMIGNCGCVEEISLPFLLWPIYRLLYLFLRQNILTDIRKSDFFFIGFCGGIHAMLRLNNAGCLVGAALVLFLYLLLRRRFATAGQGLLLGAAGFCAALLPGILYFAWHGALYDLWYGSILFNFIYAASSSSSHAWLQNLNMHAPLFALGATALLTDRKHAVLSKRAQVLITSILICGAAAVSVGRNYAHYAICILPAYVIMAAYCIAIVHRRLPSLAAAAATLVIAATALYPYVSAIRMQLVNAASVLQLHYQIPCATLQQSTTYRYVQLYAHEDRKLLMRWAQMIPEDEKKSVLAYDCFGDVYLYMNILPEYKYSFIQGGWSRHPGSRIGSEIRQHFAENPPLWLVTTRAYADIPFYQELIRPHYRLIEEDYGYALFRLNK